jgi:uncharacterized protein DUF4440
MRNFAVLFIAAVLAAITPAASHAQQKSQNLIFSAKASGETNIVEARVDPGALNAASEQAHLADRALMQAIAANDGTMATNLLASEFTWIDRDGRSRTKSDLLDRIVLLSAGPDTNLAVSVYGRVVLVTGTHALIPDGAEAFFTRVWVRQGFDWRLLLDQETAPGDFSARDARDGVATPSPATCDNPCSSLPYKPLSPDAQEIVTSFMAGEKALFEGDADSAGRILGDDATFIMPDGFQPIGKTQRVARIRSLRQADQSDPPPAVASMALWVFGGAAVMSADQESWFGQLLRTTGIWAKRDAGWQLIFSQQTQVR